MKRIVVKRYREIKDEIDDYCRMKFCGYEILKDGTAVITID